MDVTMTCRVCLSGSDELTPLRQRLPGKDKTLEETINFVANINILLESGLPDKICKDCWSMLDVADTLKQRCLESEAKLGQIDKGIDKSRLTGGNSRNNDALYSEDTSSLPTGLPCPLLSNSLEEIKTEENIYDYPEYKIKLEIVENFAEERSPAGEQDNLDCKGAQLEQLLPKKGPEITESFIDKTNKGSTWNTANEHKPSDMEIGCATEKPSKCFNNTAENSTGKVLTCDICEFTTDQMKFLTLHLKKHADEKQYSCDTCSYLTTKLGSYQDHKSTHTDEKPYVCNICEKTFSLKRTLVIHMRIHTGDKPYSCNVCRKNFNKKSNLVVHMRTHTGDKPYSCNVCKKKFTKKFNLALHTRTHTGDKPYPCNFCSKKFSQKSNLATHMRTHTGDKPYSCNRCKKKYTTKYCLDTHIRTHTGDKPYACSVCGKNYNMKRSLDAHMRIHTGDKPYSCDVCKKEFSIKRYLIPHMRIHTDSRFKDYCCNLFRKTV